MFVSSMSGEPRRTCALPFTSVSRPRTAPQNNLAYLLPASVAQALLPVLFCAHLLFSLRMSIPPATPQLGASQPSLERGLGLKEAVALNMIEIVGIGPFVVSSLVIKAMGGPQALIAWLAGALLATLDGFVWSELAPAMPKSGVTYVSSLEASGSGP